MRRLARRFAKASRLFWWALRNRDHYNAVVAWRIAKSEVWPTSYYELSESPTTTLTTQWFGKTLRSGTVDNPFYEMQKNYVDSEGRGTG